VSTLDRTAQATSEVMLAIHKDERVPVPAQSGPGWLIWPVLGGHVEVRVLHTGLLVQVCRLGRWPHWVPFASWADLAGPLADVLAHDAAGWTVEALGLPED
jgi:hypothetical protein